MYPGYSDAILIGNLLKTFCQIEELKQAKNHHITSNQAARVKMLESAITRQLRHVVWTSRGDGGADFC